MPNNNVIPPLYGTVRSYISRFESLAAQLEGVSEQILEGTFLKGLQAGLRNSVRVLQPQGLGHAIKLAIMIDENGAYSGGEQHRNVPKTAPIPRPTAVGAAGVPRPAAKDTQQPFRRMTAAEITDKRAKGLCFRCDDKFGPGHRCPEKLLQVLVIDDEDPSDDEEAHEVEHKHLDAVEVSAHSVVGITTPHTMKLRGEIQGREVVVLIDSGATHNFISLRLLAPLNLPVTGSRTTGVVMGNGKTEQSHGICKKVELLLPGLRVVEDFFPLELGSTDIILGMKWLRQLGNIQVNW